MTAIKRGQNLKIPFYIQKSRYEAGDRSAEINGRLFIQWQMPVM